jgi:hypothetical protein
MPYDAELAQRIRDVVAAEPGITDKLMFGGLAFLVDGKMAVCAGGQGDGMMLRVDPAESDALLGPPQVRRVVMRGREMAGWLHVDLEALQDDVDLRRWVALGLDYARSLAS